MLRSFADGSESGQLTALMNPDPLRQALQGIRAGLMGVSAAYSGQSESWDTQ